MSILSLVDGDKGSKWIQLVSGLHVSGVNTALHYGRAGMPCLFMINALNESTLYRVFVNDLCNLLCNLLTDGYWICVSDEMQGVYQQSLLCRRVKDGRQEVQKGL